MKIFKRSKENRQKKCFGAWQIEITTRCGLQCTMCIKTACKEWHRKDMNARDFEKIVPYLHDVKSVVLEGWGESLLHKNLSISSVLQNQQDQTSVLLRVA